MPLDLRETLMLAPTWRRSGGSAVWTPTSVANCVLWLTAGTNVFTDTAATTPASGTNDVGAWVDQVAGGTTKTVRQATGTAQPNLATVGSNTALQFDAAASQQLIGGSTGATGDSANPICQFGSGAATLAVAFRTPASIAAVYGLISEIGATEAEGDFVVRITNATPTNGITVTRAVGATPTYRNVRTANDAVAADTNYVLVWTYDGAGDADGDYALRLNGANALNDSNTTAVAGASNTKLFVGSYRGNVNFFTGHVFGVVAYRAQLTGTDLAALETYMGTLCGLSL